MAFRFGFVGESEVSAKGKLLERSFPLDTLQELSKNNYKYIFLKVLGILKPFFQEGFKRGPGAEPLADKLKFEPSYERSQFHEILRKREMPDP